MKCRSCPRCYYTSFYSSGVFWVCVECGYAVIESALSINEGVPETMERLRRERSIEEQGGSVTVRLRPSGVDDLVG